MCIYILYQIPCVYVCGMRACVRTYVYACVRTCMRARTHERGKCIYDYILYSIHIIVVLSYTYIYIHGVYTHIYLIYI